MVRGSSDPTSDELYELLSNRRRRYVIHALIQAEGPIELGELTDLVVQWEEGTDQEWISSDARKSVYTSLQQTHLPQMDEAGVVEYDKDRGVVAPTPNLDRLDIYIEFVEGKQIPWHQFYVGLFVASALLLLAVWLGAWPFVHLGSLTWGTVIVGIFGASAICHAYYMRRRRVGNHELPPDLR